MTLRASSFTYSTKSSEGPDIAQAGDAEGLALESVDIMRSRMNDTGEIRHECGRRIVMVDTLERSSILVLSECRARGEPWVPLVSMKGLFS